MANYHARIRRDIWGDEDWRGLTSSAQWLYLHLLSSPNLSFAGIADWRPPRIAALADELTAADVNMFAGELIAARFILPDPDTEEVLIRSWVKHDGLLRSPNVSKALVKAHLGTASRVLRAVLVDQLLRLQESGYEGQWQTLAPVLDKPSMTFEEGVEILSVDPSANRSGNPSDNPSVNGSGNPSENRAPLRTPFSGLQSLHAYSPTLVTHQGDDELGDDMMPLREGGLA